MGARFSVQARLAVDADAAWRAVLATLGEQAAGASPGTELDVERRLFGREAVERSVVVVLAGPTDDEPGRMELHTSGTGVAVRRVAVTPRGDLACDVVLSASLAPAHPVLTSTVGRLVGLAVRRSLTAELAELRHATA